MTALRTSDALGRLAAKGAERLTVAEVMARLGDRSFGALFLLLGTATLIPSVPGFTGLLGIALMLISAQLVVGRRSPWVPAFIARRSMRREALVRACARLDPWLKRLETCARPRLRVATTLVAERAAGITIFVLSLVIALPIPVLGNIPPAIAILLLALGLIERDGLLVLTGFAMSAVAIGLTGGLGLAAAAQLANLL